jgi:hypothetical protein
MIIRIFINLRNSVEMKKLAIILIVFGSSTCSLYSQTKTLKGRVISEYFETLPAVSIIINDTIEVGRTDANGFFLLDFPVSEKRVKFGILGMETTTIELKDKCDNIEVVMMAARIYDFMKLKRVDRKRKKRYNRLPETHKQAFEKSIFETESACYYREFESYYLHEN